LKNNTFDVIVIGGGFYGCCLALLMKKYCDKILVIEKEEDILLRASSINQARIHSGFHYPRNILTAYRSFVNFPRFVLDFKKCVYDDFEKLYAIARNNSKVNASQFFGIFKNLNVRIKKAPLKYRKLFNSEMIEDVFCVKEYAFDSEKLRDIIKHRLEKNGITVFCNTSVDHVEQKDNGTIDVFATNKEEILLKGGKVYNCAYSQINSLLKKSKLPLLPFKQEVTEISLVRMPPDLSNVGITVMDGPFFSTMPYPAKNMHSLTHVRYTPHCSWNDIDDFMDGHEYLKTVKLKSKFAYMINDAKRYLPLIKDAIYVDSLYEIKTVLLQNEIDDGRPILCKKDYGFKNYAIVMGSKIDNIYDLFKQITDKTFCN